MALGIMGRAEEGPRPLFAPGGRRDLRSELRLLSLVDVCEYLLLVLYAPLAGEWLLVLGR